MGEKALEVNLRELLGGQGANRLVGRGSREEDVKSGKEGGGVGQAVNALILVCHCRYRKRWGALSSRPRTKGRGVVFERGFENSLPLTTSAL